MKRTLVLLPLLALAAGVLLFLAHRGKLGPITLAGNPAPPVQTAPPDSGTASAPGKPAPAFSGADLGDLAAGIRFTVTARGLPLKDAKITVQKSGTPDFMIFKTEADGTQFLHSLPPAEYGIRVDHPDFIHYDTTVTLSPGQTAQMTTDLKPGGRIYGLITDKAGVPLPKTRCFLVAGENGISIHESSVESDEKGQYVIKPIQPGSYGVRYRHQKYKPQDKPVMLFRSPTDEYKVDVVLELGAKVSGRVLDEEGKPIAGAVVVASTRGSAAMERSAEDGRFSVGGLNDLPVNLEVSRPPKSSNSYGKVTLRNLPANGPDIEVRLPLAGGISGRVVTDEPVRKILLMLSKFDEETNGLVMADTKSIADPPNGVFAMPDVSPGKYWVDIRIEGYEALDRPEVVVAAGQKVDGVVVRFKKKS